MVVFICCIRVTSTPAYKSGDMFEEGTYSITFTGKDSECLTVSVSIEFQVYGKAWHRQTHAIIIHIVCPYHGYGHVILYQMNH